MKTLCVLDRCGASIFLFFVVIFIFAGDVYHSYYTNHNLEKIAIMSNDINLVESIQKEQKKELFLDIGTFMLEAIALIILFRIRNIERGEIEKRKIAEKEALSIQMSAALSLERQSKQEAEMLAKTQAEIAKAKESYLVLFSHELKTPLNAIINFSKYIAKKCQPSEEQAKIKELALSISKNGQNILDTVNNMLEIARIKSGKIVANKEDVDIKRIINDMVQLYKELAIERQMETVLDFKDEIHIKSDRLYLGYLLSNIYTNALKYGSSKILITTKKHNDVWNIIIEDDGSGIKDVEAVFELFEQGEDRHTQGTGVGLYFCKLLSELLGLSIKIDRSENLGGAMVTITQGEMK